MHDILMNALSSLDETDSEYSPAPTDDLIRFWRSKVKVAAGRRAAEGIHVDAGASKSIFLLYQNIIQVNVPNAGGFVAVPRIVITSCAADADDNPSSACRRSVIRLSVEMFAET